MKNAFADCANQDRQYIYITIRCKIKPGFVQKGIETGIWAKDIQKKIDKDEEVKGAFWKVQIEEN